VHAAEAAHGDLGMITADDVLIAISYSGSGEELLKIVPLVKRQGARLIAITGNPESPLAREADVHLDGSVKEEACPLNLAPTASTTAALALSDALAVALLDARGFGAEDFARSHPGGTLGRRLLTHVSDVMRSGKAVPQVPENALLADALMEMTRAGMGMTAIVDADQRIIGIYTDGDLRRSLASNCDFTTARVADVMSRGPKTIQAEALAVEAAEIMETRRISQLLVTNRDGRLIGALNHHDLMLAKVI
jgi:arabinose-5-phosphate isomerase